MKLNRRHALAAGLALSASGLRAQNAPEHRHFAPEPGPWRTFEITTRVDLKPATMTGSAALPAQVWVPLPSVEGDGWQRTFGSTFAGNARSMKAVADGQDGARMLHAVFDDARDARIEVTSRVATRSRREDWSPAGRDGATLGAAERAFWTRATDLMPTDGLVAETAREITAGARGDLAKTRAIYEWIVERTHREPKVRGCGTGDIRAMLETGNLSGKCGDINALFVGLARAAGIPARDVYGIRLAPSAFGYRELGAHPAKLQGAQHCRAEVFLSGRGWVAMDPADVGKVMRQETPEWIRDPRHALVDPIRQALFGGWEGNWLAWNTAHDVQLPGSTGPKLGFMMYPQAEIGGVRQDELAPDAFRYVITSKEV